MRRELDSDAKLASRIDRQYDKFASQAASDADRLAARADVKGVEEVLARVRQKDAQLGNRRSGDVKTLVAELESQLDTAKQRRLDLDRWAYRDETYRLYRRGIGASLTLLDKVTGTGEAIRSMSGPNLRDLEAAVGRSLHAHHAVGHQLGAELERVRRHLLRQLEAGDGLEAGIVLDPLRVEQLATGDALFEHHGPQHRAASVQRAGEARSGQRVHLPGGISDS